jgi:hypothetical protein
MANAQHENFDTYLWSAINPSPVYLRIANGSRTVRTSSYRSRLSGSRGICGPQVAVALPSSLPSSRVYNARPDDLMHPQRPIRYTRRSCTLSVGSKGAIRHPGCRVSEFPLYDQIPPGVCIHTAIPDRRSFELDWPRQTDLAGEARRPRKRKARLRIAVLRELSSYAADAGTSAHRRHSVNVEHFRMTERPYWKALVMRSKGEDRAGEILSSTASPRPPSRCFPSIQ